MANFDEATIQAVWEKAKIDSNNNPDVFRKDYAGAWIKRNQYGQQTKYGWQIDHLRPEAKDGSNDLSNLLPLHWENNEAKSDDYPKWKTSKSSNGTENIDKEQHWFVKNHG